MKFLNYAEKQANSNKVKEQKEKKNKTWFDSIKDW